MPDEQEQEERYTPDFIMMFNDMVSGIVKYRTGKWDEQTFKEHMNNIVDGVHEQVGEFDPHEFNHYELSQYGLVPWNDEVFIIPFWLLDKVEDGTELIKVPTEEDGERETVVVGEDSLDEHLNWGLTPYGVEVQRPEEDEDDDGVIITD